MSKFKVGDIVKMHGVVTRVEFNNTFYPVKVSFKGFRLAFTEEGKYLKDDTESTLELVERPKKPVPFKDWEEGKRYETLCGSGSYIKKDGLPWYVCDEDFSCNPIGFFAKNDFYEVVEDE